MPWCYQKCSTTRMWRKKYLLILETDQARVKNEKLKKWPYLILTFSHHPHAAYSAHTESLLSGLAAAAHPDFWTSGSSAVSATSAAVAVAVAASSSSSASSRRNNTAGGTNRYLKAFILCYPTTNYNQFNSIKKRAKRIKNFTIWL